MTGEERRNELLKEIKESSKPISGTALARKYQVSRQVIVQDIALLRVKYNQIYSTPKGYIFMDSQKLYSGMNHIDENKSPSNNELVNSAEPKAVIRVFKVSHTDEQTQDELNTIVDMGGKVADVIVEHEIYGAIRADLSISCRRHVQEFIEGICSGKSRPLKNLSASGIHYHTVEADSEETLDLIQQKLDEKGYLSV